MTQHLTEITQARQLGAKFHRKADGDWVVLYPKGVYLGTAVFPTCKAAAKAFIEQLEAEGEENYQVDSLG